MPQTGNGPLARQGIMPNYAISKNYCTCTLAKSQVDAFNLLLWYVWDSFSKSKRIYCSLMDFNFKIHF